MIHDVIEQGDIVLLDPLLYFQLMAQFWTDQMVRAGLLEIWSKWIYL